jgi:hypothetical protein
MTYRITAVRPDKTRIAMFVDAPSIHDAESSVIDASHELGWRIVGVSRVNTDKSQDRSIRKY